MQTSLGCDRVQKVVLGAESHRLEFARDVEAGLLAEPRRLSCRYFYDAAGSDLFEAICELPEYYLTRTERRILQENADDIAAAVPFQAALLELGSGSSVKTRLLIEALLRRQGSLRYVSIDISPTILEQASEALLDTYPELNVVTVAAEYTQGLRWLETGLSGPRLILWLGSNVGNFDRTDAAQFLSRIRETMGPEDRLLMGVDLRKARAVLEPAYDDAAGVTARFNLNLLQRINRELGGRFDLSQFQHQAVYNEERGRVEMHLVSRRAQRVYIDVLDREFTFREGEAIHTESSYKYSEAEIAALAAETGLRVERQWFDADRWFSVNLLAPGS